MNHTYTTIHTLELSDAEYRTLRDVVAHHDRNSGSKCTSEWASILAGFGLETCHDKEESDTWTEIHLQCAKPGDTIRTQRNGQDEVYKVGLTTDEWVECIRHSDGALVHILHNEYTIIDSPEWAHQGDVIMVDRDHHFLFNHMPYEVSLSNEKYAFVGEGSRAIAVPHGAYRVIKRTSETTPERAEVGDVVCFNKLSCYEVYDGANWVFCSKELFDRDYVVIGREDDKVVVDYSPSVSKIFMKDGTYTTVKREEPDKAQVGDTIIYQGKTAHVVGSNEQAIYVLIAEKERTPDFCDFWKLTHGQYTIVRRAPDKVEKPGPTTAELVDMLAKREGVETKRIGNYARVAIYNAILVDPLTWYRDGPATILVIPGGDGE